MEVGSLPFTQIVCKENILTNQILFYYAAHILSAVVPLACGDDPSSIIPVLPHLCYRKVPERKINTALLNIEMGKAVYDKPLILYLQSEQCYKVLC